MASAPHIGAASHRAIPVHVMLSAIPSLPQPMLARLVERMIDRLDELDGDSDLETDDDDHGVDDGQEDDRNAQPA